MSEEVARMNRAAMQAMAARDFKNAQAILQEALGRDNSSVSLWLNLAVVRRQLEDVEGTLEALREVLKLDSRNFAALLMRASVLDRLGQSAPAAQAYGVALAQAPADRYLDPPTLQAVERARVVHGQYVGELGKFIRERAATTADRCTAVERHRIETFIDTTLRTRKRYRQEPSDYYYPGLPAIEFYERDEFPWLEQFEAATADIQRELATILIEDEPGFEPYIHYEDHLPLDQWRELNKSPRWSAFHFYHLGQPIEERCRRAPLTLQAVRRLPQAQVDLRSPTAMFSVLKPRTRIPPHTGVANFRLVVHLPLVLPPGCRFRVGGDMRAWRMGQAWVFDDTIEHEAWNDSDETRIILICDVWSPRLSPEERAAIRAVIAATDAFNGTVPPAHI
ncbi:MAG TPA: aspartyl/asparaginyl beta-hydroxylase domain-containing protein [Steroidobacteraceae bacterium]|nr:aspartyl/asparaginyl beta-hydroxylase domain-containing protein [Steroidobacteraceae bacterium]